MSRPLAVLERIVELIFCHVQIFARGRRSMLLWAISEILLIPTLLLCFYFLAGSGHGLICYILGSIIAVYHYLIARVSAECAFNDGMEFTSKSAKPVKSNELELMLAQLNEKTQLKH